MRVIAGERRGLRLEAPAGMAARPTADRVKESIFNILAHFEDARVLDLFAGSGGIGLEFLSRGAKEVTFVEKNPVHIPILKSNVKKARYEERVKIVCRDARMFLQSEKAGVYDFIFLDPPYDSTLVEESLSLIHEGGYVATDGIIIVETRRNCIPLFEPFRLAKKKEYGSTSLYFLTR